MRYRAHAMFGALDVIPGPLLRSAARLGYTVTAPLGEHSRFRRRLQTAETLFGQTPDERYLHLMSVMNPRAPRRPSSPGSNGETSKYLLDVMAASPATRPIGWSGPTS